MRKVKALTPGWTLHTYSGDFSPDLEGPRNRWVTADENSVTIEHEIFDGSLVSVTVPRDCLAALMNAADEYRKAKK